MATTMTTDTAHGPETVTEPSPEVADAFVADRQAFWARFTSFVTVATGGIVVLLILLAFFLA